MLNSELFLPDFVENNFVMNPIIGLKLIISNDQMYLDQTREEVVCKVLNEINQIIESCNCFVRPEFAKLNIISHYEFLKQEEEEETMNKMTFQTNKKENEYEDLLFGGLERNIYSKYLGRIKMSKSEKESKEIIFSKEEAHIFKKSSVEKFMKIADPSEECYILAKRKIEFVLLSQYDACSNTYSIFTQLQPIITSEMNSKITVFLLQEIKSKYDYYKLVAEIKNFRELVFQIPLTIHFPLFSVSCSSVREELLNRTEEMLSRVFKSLEAEVIEK
jgi:hypothetical protein